MPESHSQSSPQFAWCLLYVSDVDASISLYTTAFGLSVRFRTPEGDYCELETGATALALCSKHLAAESTGLVISDDNHHPKGNITLVYGDVAAAWARAIGNNAVAVKPPQQKPWGQTTAYVMDLDGHLIELATPVHPPA